MVPDEDEDITLVIGCSDAVAREAAPSSANVIINDDIMQGMPPGAVNLVKVASVMGRGPNHKDNGESAHRLEDDGQMNVDRRDIEKRTTDRASDGERSA